MKVNKIGELKKAIVDTIKHANVCAFPEVIEFSVGIEHPQFRITIEEIQNEVFIDSKGIKWRRMPNDNTGEDRV